MGLFHDIFKKKRAKAPHPLDLMLSSTITAPWVVCQDREVAAAVKEVFPDLYVAALREGSHFNAHVDEAFFVEGH